MKSEEILKDCNAAEKIQLIRKALDRFELGRNQAVQIRIIERISKSLKREIKS